MTGKEWGVEGEGGGGLVRGFLWGEGECLGYSEGLEEGKRRPVEIGRLRKEKGVFEAAWAG